MAKKKDGDSGFNPESLLKQFLRTATQVPGGGRQRLGQAIKGMVATMKRQAKSATADFREHLGKVRRSRPPLSIRVLPAADEGWLESPPLHERVEALCAAGFQRVGVFRMEANPQHAFAGFVHPQAAVQALLARAGASPVLELASFYDDGSVLEATDMAGPAGAPTPPWVTSHRLPGLGVEALFHEFLKLRPAGGLTPLTSDGFAERIEEGFGRVQCWRAARGGFTQDEVQAMQQLGDDPEARQQAAMLRDDHAQRWLCNWLLLQKGLDFTLDDVIDVLVVVYEGMPADLLANAWWCGAGDFDVQAGEFEGGEPLAVFGEVNRRRGGPLRLVCRKPAPFAADFYLPAERPAPEAGASALVQALRDGVAKGDLRRALNAVADYEIATDADARAVCEALAALRPETSPQFARDAQALTRLFHQVPDPDSPAAARFKAEGLPVLMQRFEELGRSADPMADIAAIFILKTLATSATAEGTDKVVAAAQAGFDANALGWAGIFSQYQPEHPQAARLYAALSGQLPPDGPAAALLGVANTLCRGGASLRHPFDTPAGRERLRSWIEAANPESTSRAHIATAAIPFLGEPGRESLLAAAARHPDLGVRMESAWAAAKLGRGDGLQQLVEFCADWRATSEAQQYLRELGREDLIPAATREPSFAALADMCSWLAHPNELGRLPDELEIVDHRELPWPPERARKPFWVIRYRTRGVPAADAEALAEDDVGCGLVGSVTFCLFTPNLTSRPPEDVYAVHCAWEMEQRELLTDEGVGTDEAAAHAGLLRQWRGEPLQEPVLVRVVKISKALQYPRRVVGLARATRDGQDGYAILDGPASAWHAAPPLGEDDREAHESLLLRLHVGRQLLGF